MKVPLSWLRELAPTDLAADELAELITRRGVKVEGILDPWDGLDGVTVAEVLEVRDHPTSDKLCLARIRHAAGEIEVVVGVRNMGEGDLVPWAAPGSRVPSLPEALAAREIRGVVSHGMLCSAEELNLGHDRDGILVLDEPGFDVGTDLKSALGLDEPVLDIEVEPNRPDFLSVLGVAREVAAVTGAPLRVPPDDVTEVAARAVDAVTLRIEARDACPRYVARVLGGVRAARSPLLARARLTAAGMRPISAVVDATNYVMLELGQPIHAFDLQRVRGPGIVVRTAVDGERLATLDGVERVLTPDDLLICDVERPIAIAGIMGGAAAEVDEATTDVVLESASFSRTGVLRSARRLDLHTEASHRFERGTDPEGLDRAAARCAMLIAAWTGASVLEGPVTDGETPPRRWVSMRPDRAASLLAYPVSADDAVGVFSELGFDHRVDEGRLVIEVEVPGYRVDIDREVDLIEEIVRVQGYDRVGSRLPRAPQAGGLPEDYAFAAGLKETLRAAGLREIRPAPFESIDDGSIGGTPVAGDGDAIAIANPLRAEEGYLRTRLTPGLLHAVARNQALGTRSVALFEVGTVFRRVDPGPFEQRRKVAFVLAGPIGERWHEEHRVADALDARGVLEAVLEDAAVESWSLGETPGEPFHPGRSAWVTIAGERAGVLGELHPRVASALEIDGRVALCELEVTALIEGARKEFVFREVPRVPPVRRDLAFVVPAHVPAGELEAALEEAGGALLDEVIVFDTYEGPPLPAGTKSLAFAVAFRDPERTLGGDEVQPLVDRIAALVAERFGGELRAG